MLNEMDLFERWKETLNRRYGQCFDSNLITQSHNNLISAYKAFSESNYSDNHYTKEIHSKDLNKSAQRLGEALLFERLAHADLKPTSEPEGPDFKVIINDKTIWLELITPSAGDDLKINELFTSHDPLWPCPHNTSELLDRTLLRVSSAIANKLKVYERYLEKNIVQPEDPLIIVVNDALLCPDTYFYGISFNADKMSGGRSLAEHAVNGIGPSVWVPSENPTSPTLKSTSRELAKNRPEPKKDGTSRDDVPVSLFTHPSNTEAAETAKRATILSAVLQVTLREDYGVLMHLRNKAETKERLLETQICKGVLTTNARALNPISNGAYKALTTVVMAPTLTPKELWDLENRRLKLFLGDSFTEQPFPAY